MLNQSWQPLDCLEKEKKKTIYLVHQNQSHRKFEFKNNILNLCAFNMHAG